MPLKGEAFIEYQRRRRLAARPCGICGEVGQATETHKAAAGAAEIRCCLSCYRKIIAPAPTPTSGGSLRRNTAMCEINANCNAVAARVESVAYTDKNGNPKLAQRFYCETCWRERPVTPDPPDPTPPGIPADCAGLTQ